mgnify:CR=1 FL=1
MTGATTAGVRIRSATPADYDGITAIYNHYVGTSNVTFDITPFSKAERVPWFGPVSYTHLRAHET